MADTSNWVIQAADRLHKVADKDFLQWTENIHDCLGGESAELLIEKCLRLADKMAATERELRDIGEDMRRNGE